MKYVLLYVLSVFFFVSTCGCGVDRHVGAFVTVNPTVNLGFVPGAIQGFSAMTPGIVAQEHVLRR
jgi:hypothetical protein